METQAENQFDALPVLMFDRLGCREDETPFLAEWFAGHGIEVRSTRQGRKKIENRSGQLSRFIRSFFIRIIRASASRRRLGGSRCVHDRFSRPFAAEK